MRVSLSQRWKSRRIEVAIRCSAPLSLSERWKLHQITVAVRRSDPRLAGLLAMFTKVSARDAMPGHERLDATGPGTGLMG